MEKFEIKNMLYKANLKSRALSVMLYLIDRSNKELVCFPSIKTISSDLNISISTTKRALNSLVEIGLIEKIERFLDTTGKQTSNLYVINIENIKNCSFSSKIEKIEDEKEVLEIFENVESINKDNQQEDENIKQDINLKNISENTEEINLSSKKIIVEDCRKNIHKKIDKKITIFDLILKDIKDNSLIKNNFLDTLYLKTGIPKYFFHKINTKTPYIIFFKNIKSYLNCNNKNIKKIVLDKFKKLDKMKYTFKDYFTYINELHPSSFLHPL